MFGIFEDLLNNPTVIRTAAKASGIQAARLDVNPASGELVASLRIHGQVKQVKIPTGKIFTIEQILAMLFAEQPGQKWPDELSGSSPQRIHLHAEIETTFGKTPP